MDLPGFDGADFHCERIAVIEEGPLRSLIEITARHGESTLISTIVLPDAADLPVDLRPVKRPGQMAICRGRMPG